MMAVGKDTLQACLETSSLGLDTSSKGFFQYSIDELVTGSAFTVHSSSFLSVTLELPRDERVIIKFW